MGFFPDFFPYPFADSWVSTLLIRMAVQSQPDDPIVLFPQNVFLAVNKLIPSSLWCFLFKLFRQSSSINFHFEVQLAFAVVGTQSSATRWGKLHLLFTSVLSPAFIWYSLVLLVKETASNCPFSTSSISSCPSRLLLLLPPLSLNPCSQCSYWYLVYLDPE